MTKKADLNTLLDIMIMIILEVWSFLKLFVILNALIVIKQSVSRLLTKN